MVGDVRLRGLPERQDHVFDPEQADAVGARRRGALGRLGDRDVHLHLRRRHRLDGGLGARGLDRLELLAGLGRLVFARPDRPLVAVEGDLLAVLEDAGPVPRPDDRGDAELAGDDRRVARHPALVGDDAGGAFHRGHHVGHRHLGHHHVAVLDLVEVIELVNEPDRPGDDAGAGAEPVDEDVRVVPLGSTVRAAPRRPALAVGGGPAGASARSALFRPVLAAGVLLDRGDRARLEHVYLAVVDGPLDVLRGAVVVLHALAELDEVADLRVREDSLAPAVLVDVELDRLACLLVFHHLHLLVRDGDLIDRLPLAVVHVVVG